MQEELFKQQYFGNTVLQYATAAAIITASIIAARIVFRILNRHVKKLAGQTDSRLDDYLIDSVEEPLALLVITIGLSIAFTTITFPESMRNLPGGIVKALVILDIMWVMLRIIDIIMEKYLKPMTKKSKTDLDEQIFPIVRKGMKIAVIVIGLLIILDTFGVDVTALIAGLGIGGLALALASKDTVENMFGALAILLDKPFKIRDRVVLDGVTGDVMEVGFRSTRIKTLDNTELYLPNSTVVTSNIENISRPNKQLAVSFTLGVTYDTPLSKIREGIEIVRKILAETEGVSTKYEPKALFREFGSSSLNIWVKYWVENYRDRLTVMDAVNQKIMEDFEKAKLEFAYPTQTIHVKK